MSYRLPLSSLHLEGHILQRPELLTGMTARLRTQHIGTILGLPFE